MRTVSCRLRGDGHIWASNQYADLAIVMCKPLSLVFLMILTGSKNSLAQGVILKAFVYKQIKPHNTFLICKSHRCRGSYQYSAAPFAYVPASTAGLFVLLSSGTLNLFTVNRVSFSQTHPNYVSGTSHTTTAIPDPVVPNRSCASRMPCASQC